MLTTDGIKAFLACYLDLVFSFVFRFLYSFFYSNILPTVNHVRNKLNSRPVVEQ